MKRLGTIFVAAALWGCGASNAQSGAGTSSAVSAAAADGDSAADSGVNCGPGSASAAAAQACAGKAAGDACSYTDAHDTDTGNCQLASDGTTLTCVEDEEQ